MENFEDKLRDKLAGHEYDYHPQEWARMQHKLNAHTSAVSAAKTALLKKTLVTAGKITGGLVSAGAIVYTALSLAGMVDRTDLGFGEKAKANSPIVTNSEKILNPSSNGALTLNDREVKDLSAAKDD